MVIKGGTIAAAPMGDPNASIPTPQPVHYRPMFGSYGRSAVASAVHFVSAAAVDDAVHHSCGLQRELCAVRNTRGGIGKAAMIHNARHAGDRGRPRDLRGPRRRRAAHLRAGHRPADGAALLPVLRFCPAPVARTDTHLRDKARSLRREPTEAEKRLWSILRDRQLSGANFRRQHPIPPYVADFACVDAKLVVERGRRPAATAEQLATPTSQRQGWRVLHASRSR